MTYLFSAISVGAALIGIYYLAAAFHAEKPYGRREAVETASVLMAISALAMVASFVGAMK